MTGTVDDYGRALVTIEVRALSPSQPTTFQAWIDTGFTGELVLPHKLIEQIGLQESAVVSAGLGDGTETLLRAYSCTVDWFGSLQQVEAIASEGTFPLLGVGLLLGHRLQIDYQSLQLTLD